MAASTRQSNLFAAEDWKKVYETFREADFQSYDYETIRKSMVDYLRNYYPEDFNDFIESSEYIALIDLIAFLGQSLSFRADLMLAKTSLKQQNAETASYAWLACLTIIQSVSRLLEACLKLLV